jgi:hypothetical protein
MPESTRPLLKGNSLSLSKVMTTYVELLRIETDPSKELLVDTIEVAIDDTTSNPLINISLNGSPYIKDFPVLNTSARFSFGRDLKLTKHKVPILVEVKKTAAGLGTLRATAWATGIER